MKRDARDPRGPRLPDGGDPSDHDQPEQGGSNRSLRRLVERPAGGDGLDDRVAALLRQVPPAAPLAPEALRTVERRLGRRGRREAPFRGGLRLAVAASLLCGTTGAVFARRDLARFITTMTAPRAPEPEAEPASRTAKRRRPEGARHAGAPGAELPVAGLPAAEAPIEEPVVAAAPPPAEVAPPADVAADVAAPAAPPQIGASARGGEAPPRRSARGAHAPGPRTLALAAPPPPVAAAVEAAPPVEAPPPAETPPAAPEVPVPTTLEPPPLRLPTPAAAVPLAGPGAAAPVAAPSPPRSVPPVRPQVSPLGQESALLKRAVERRRHGDAAGALRALDELAQRFPDGQLARDARIVRVDALVALERRDEALGLLEQMPLDGTPRGDDLRLLRAELRAQRSCVGALPEFDRLVNRALPAALAERALVGRGLCRLRGGDAAGGRQDLERYLARFPEGRFAAAARAQLAAPRPGR